ncbi:MAG: Na+:solute symporter, partial [Lutibacter sp.]|nr:Na+:solute symporter [Lutibacter sp.]
ASIQEAFPAVSQDKLGHDLAYSAMLTKLPSGLLGLVLASLVAAYMSTISTHLNWGSSYVVNDFYKQQIDPNASEKKLVMVGRLSTVALMILSALMALALTNALQLFEIIVMFGAGTGLIFILRWFWWRINAWSEITAMFSSGIISILLTFTPLAELIFNPETGFLPGWAKFPLIVFTTTLLWLLATYLTAPEDSQVLRAFYKKIQPGGPGWRKVLIKAETDKVSLVTEKGPWSVPSGILAILLGLVLVYTALFATGYFIYGQYLAAFILTGICAVAGLLLARVWKKIKVTIL